MKKINILVDKSKIIDYLVTPIRHNKKKLNELGYNINFYCSISNRFLTCDILLLTSKATFKILNEKQELIIDQSPTLELLRKARKYTNKIIWLDSSDSTGVTHFELLPYVDLYLKKQLLKDKSLYKKEFYGGRIFTDYYHKKFGVKDEKNFTQYFPLEEKYLHKVDLSWNIGLGDMFNSFTKINELRLKFPWMFKVNYELNFTSPEKKRNNDFFIRTTYKLQRETVAFHRKELLKRLNNLLTKRENITGSTNGRYLSIRKFRKQMSDSKILPSPFGWGELGVRDYEAFIYGAVLLKPDISFMETWPNIFIENETYKPFRWGFEDFEIAVLDLLNDDYNRIKIATQGQESYKYSISQKGMEEFCNWFIKQIEK